MSSCLVHKRQTEALLSGHFVQKGSERLWLHRDCLSWSIPRETELPWQGHLTACTRLRPPLCAPPLPSAKEQLTSVEYLANPCSEDSHKVALWRQ